ncbi:MAG: hypothetical protein SFW07_03995 [Gammaproteobacteria bacterium]|nr:hypothetical protein [Gammaproteobacteria bacterium]
MESNVAKKNINVLLFLAVGVLCSPSLFAEPVPIVPQNPVANNPIQVPKPTGGSSFHVPKPDGVGSNGNHNGFDKGNGNHGQGNNGNHDGFGKGNGNHGLGNNGNHNGFDKGNGNHGQGNNGNHNGFDKGNGNHGQGNNGNHDGFGKGNGNHGLGNNGNHNGFDKGNGNHGQGNNGNHNGNGKGNGNHDKDKNGNNGWRGKDDSDRRNSFKEFNRKHKVDLPNVVGKYQNANASCGGGANNSGRQSDGHGRNHGVEKVPQVNISNNQVSAATAGLGTLVGSDVKDQTVVPVQTAEVPLPSGTASTIDINGDDLIHLETTAPAQPNSGVPFEVSHGHTSMTVQEVKQVLNDLVSLGNVAEAEVLSVTKGGEVVLHAVESSSSTPTVEPLVNTIVNNPAPQGEVSVVPSAPSVETVSEPISPNVLDSSSSQTVINNPLNALLKESDIQSVSDYSNSTRPSQLENTNQSLIVVGQVVKISGSAVEIDQNGGSHTLGVGNNVHLGSKFKFTGGAGSLVIRSFTGELINVEV